MLLEVGFGWWVEIWCTMGEQRIVIDPEHQLVASTPDEPTSETIGELYVVSWWSRRIGYMACVHDIPPPMGSQLDILCVGGEAWDIATLTLWLELLHPKYCIPLGLWATNKAQQRSQEVMATGNTFPKLLRPWQVVVMQNT